MGFVVCRWFWYIPRLAELFHPFCNVHLLRTVSSWASLPEISLVEEVHDFNADCMFTK